MFLLMPLILLCSCATLTTTKHDPVIIPEFMEIQFGLATKLQVDAQYKSYNDRELSAYVTAIGNRLASVSSRSSLKYSFTVVDSKEINAFAVPGGFVYVTTGLIKALDDEAQLAAVIGHEIGHIDRQHGVKALQRHIVATQGLAFLEKLVNEGKPAEQKSEIGKIAASAGLQLLFLRNSRENEFEADEQGALLASRVGYDPYAIVDVQHHLLKLRQGTPSALEQMLSTHPISEARINHANNYIKNNNLGGKARSKDVYAKMKARIK